MAMSKEAAIRDIYVGSTCTGLCAGNCSSFFTEFRCDAFLNFVVPGTDLSNQFLLKTIPLETETVSQDGSSASGRHASADVDVRHFESERNGDREEGVFSFCSPCVPSVRSATVVGSWAEWPLNKFRDQEEFVR